MTTIAIIISLLSIYISIRTSFKFKKYIIKQENLKIIEKTMIDGKDNLFPTE